MHARLVGTTINHDALDVNVIFLGDDLCGEPAEQKEHDERSEEVGGRTSGKHAQAFSARRSHQLVRLRFSKGTERQRAKLKQTKRANAHAMTASQQTVAKLVNDKGNDEGQCSPTERDNRIEARDGDHFAG